MVGSFCHLLPVPLNRPRRRQNALHHVCQRSKGQRGVPICCILTCCAVAAAAAAAAHLRLPLPIAGLREGCVLQRGEGASRLKGT